MPRHTVAARRRRGFFIREAIKKPGALRRQLGVKDSIPSGALRKIAAADVGETVTVRVAGKSKKMKVTGRLKKRAVLARTLRGLPRARDAERRRT